MEESLIKEQWLPIKGFEGYEVSNLGRVRSFKRKYETILSPRITKKGYLVVLLCNNGKRFSKQVHRLVLETFNPIHEMEKYEVNHKDEVKTNNNLTNLEWLSHKENVNYGTGHDRSANKQKVRVLCVETGVIYSSMKEAAELTNCNYGNISSACKNSNRTCGGFHWQKVDDLDYQVEQ